MYYDIEKFTKNIKKMNDFEKSYFICSFWGFTGFFLFLYSVLIDNVFLFLLNIPIIIFTLYHTHLLIKMGKNEKL